MVLYSPPLHHVHEMCGDFRLNQRFLHNHVESQGAAHMGVLWMTRGIKLVAQKIIFQSARLFKETLKGTLIILSHLHKWHWIWMVTLKNFCFLSYQQRM